MEGTICGYCEQTLRSFSQRDVSPGGRFLAAGRLSAKRHRAAVVPQVNAFSLLAAPPLAVPIKSTVSNQQREAHGFHAFSVGPFTCGNSADANRFNRAVFPAFVHNAP